jgi:hypothetical protein
MIFRVVSGLFVVLSVWSAYLQLNDPDPARWVAIYLACAVVAGCEVSAKSQPKLALAVALVALGWALFILPLLFAGWQPGDLTAKMTTDRPDIEYGREFGGLIIVAGYCLVAFLRSFAGRRLPV